MDGNRLRNLIEAADVLALVRAVVEPDGAGNLPLIELDGFACPACQATPGSWILHAPAARLVAECVAECVWRCDLCGASGTRWGLARRVLEDPSALNRFLLLFSPTAA